MPNSFSKIATQTVKNMCSGQLMPVSKNPFCQQENKLLESAHVPKIFRSCLSRLPARQVVATDYHDDLADISDSIHKENRDQHDTRCNNMPTVHFLCKRLSRL
jgi:hypothetical protein